MSSQVQLGKAFEYALAAQISQNTSTQIVSNSALLVARKYYTQTNHTHMDKAASEAAIFLQCHDERIDKAPRI